MSDASGHVTPAQQLIHAASLTQVTDEEVTVAARILAGDDWEKNTGDGRPWVAGGRVVLHQPRDGLACRSGQAHTQQGRSWPVPPRRYGLTRGRARPAPTPPTAADPATPEQKTTLKNIITISILSIDPPRKVDEQFLKNLF